MALGNGNLMDRYATMVGHDTIKIFDKVTADLLKQVYEITKTDEALAKDRKKLKRRGVVIPGLFVGAT